MQLRLRPLQASRRETTIAAVQAIVIVLPMVTVAVNAGMNGAATEADH